MKHVLLAIAISAALSGCNEDDTNGDTIVFEARGSTQCGPPGMSTEQSAQKLTSSGVEVVRSACGVITGVSFPAACGGPDGKILLHEIRTLNLKDAEVLGFRSAKLLTDPATGRDFERTDCNTGAIIQ